MGAPQNAPGDVPRAFTQNVSAGNDGLNHERVGAARAWLEKSDRAIAEDISARNIRTNTGLPSGPDALEERLGTPYQGKRQGDRTWRG